MAHLLGELSWQAQLASIAQTQKQFQKKAQTQLQTKKNQACSKGIIVIFIVIACFNWQRINFLFLDVINLKQMLMLSSGQCPQVNSIVVPSMSSDWCSSRLISAAIVAQNQNGLWARSELISGENLTTTSKLNRWIFKFNIDGVWLLRLNWTAEYFNSISMVYLTWLIIPEGYCLNSLNVVQSQRWVGMKYQQNIT